MSTPRLIFELAWTTLLENRLRSSLTVLGMMFGNAAVIATLSSNEGAKQFVNEQLKQLGTRLMAVESNGQPFDLSAADFLMTYEPGLAAPSLDERLGSASIRYKESATESVLIVGYDGFISAHGLSIDSGRMFSESEKSSSDPVVIIGNSTSQNLFGKNVPFVGEWISIHTENQILTARIIGSFKEKGGSDGSSIDNAVILHQGMATQIRSNPSSQKILLQLKDPNRS